MTRRTPKPIRWFFAARRDLFDIADYIAADSEAAAERFVDELEAHVDLLAEAPYLGSVCPHSQRYRQLIHGNYIVYYSVHRAEIVIRAVVHGARLFRSARLRRED